MAKQLVVILMLLLTYPSLAESKEKWHEYKRNHFIIYYIDAPRGFVETVEDMAETYYDDITKNLGFTRYKGWTWDQRAKIYIYDDQEHYKKSLKMYRWSHGVASPKDKVIRTFPTAHGFFDSTLPHELGHIIFREFVGFKAHIPLWFEEGIAMYQEKAQRWGAHQTVRDAIEDETFIPLGRLSTTRLTNKTDPKKINLFYAESASVVNYLITEMGQYRFVRFCRALKKGKPFDWALDSIYVRFKNVEDLNRNWVKYLKRK